MKKLFAIVIALAMMASLSVSALAVTVGSGSKDIDVKAEYKDNSTTPDKISVDVSWQAMEFTYTVSGENSWDDTNHAYNDNTTGTWTSDTNTVTVINHSNVKVTVTFDFVVETGYDGRDGIKGSFTKQTFDLKSAAGIGTDAASLQELTGTTALALSGKLKSGTEKNTKVGTIIVEIKKSNVQ